MSRERRRKNFQEERKILQLCKQVERRLSLVLAGEINDEILDGLLITEVSAPFGPSILKVEIALPRDKQDLDKTLVIERLQSISGWLRSEIAQEIHRKRTPKLTFSIAEDDPFDEATYF